MVKEKVIQLPARPNPASASADRQHIVTASSVLDMRPAHREVDRLLGQHKLRQVATVCWSTADGLHAATMALASHIGPGFIEPATSTNVFETVFFAALQAWKTAYYSQSNEVDPSRLYIARLLDASDILATTRVDGHSVNGLLPEPWDRRLDICEWIEANRVSRVGYVYAPTNADRRAPGARHRLATRILEDRELTSWYLKIPEGTAG
jgi:hypothetical protein